MKILINIILKNECMTNILQIKFENKPDRKKIFAVQIAS